MFGFAPFGSETFGSHGAVAIVYGNIENIALTLSLQQKQDLSLQLEYNIINIPLTINVREPVNLTV
jgi:ABC-type sulfate transport system permease subunit